MAGFAGFGGKRPAPGVDLTPILDILVSVIFFLLIFSAFNELSQISLPPVERGSVASTELSANPLPRLILSVKQGLVTISLKWYDAKPGELRKDVPASSMTSKDIWIAEVRDLIKPYLDSHPNHKTLQIGLDRGFNFQHLVLTIDAVAEYFPDIALIAPDEIASPLAGGS